MSDRVAFDRAASAVRRQAAFWLGMFSLLLILGSLYPFRFESSDVFEAISRWVTKRPSSRSDLVVNFVAGVPIGILGFLSVAGGRRKVASLTAAVLTIAYAIALSTFVEIAQCWTPSRVSSVGDSCAQVAGASLGMALALVFGRWACERLVAARMNSEGRVAPLLDLYVFGYALFLLQPFVPAISPTELSSKWKAGALELIPMVQWATDPWGSSYTALVCFATALPVGGWLAIRLTRCSNTVVSIYAAALVSMFEIFQVGIESRVFSSDDVIWSGFGAIAGVAAVRRAGPELNRVSAERRRSLARGALVVYCLTYLVSSLAPFDLVSTVDEAIERIGGFASSPLGPLGNHLSLGSNLLRAALWSAPLGVLSVLSLRPDNAKVVVLVPLVGSAAVLGEAVQIVSEAHGVSIIAALARACGALAGLFYSKWLLRPPYAPDRSKCQSDTTAKNCGKPRENSIFKIDRVG